MSRYLCKTAFTILACTSFIMPVYAGTDFPKDSMHLPKDSTTPYYGKNITVIPGNNIAENYTDDLVESNLLNADNYNIKTKADVRALFHFLKSTKLSNASRDKRISYRLYFGLAKTFVKMKLYPLAMKCYQQSVLLADETVTEKNNHQPDLKTEEADLFFTEDNNSTAVSTYTSTDTTSANVLPVNELFNYSPSADSFFTRILQQKHSSMPVSNESILDSYNDGKQAAAYAIVLHVKQPVPGKRTPFTHINNVGHFFITLIKYNDDSGYVSRSFGFYPDKNSFFSATPIHPGSASVMKDDALHDWDEAIGKFISRRRFEKIIRLIDHFNSRQYHLNKNNCTDFGLYAATIAGVSISNTTGNWPLGKGNNPGNAGQSMLEGKILNTDTGNKQYLFICNNAKRF